MTGPRRGDWSVPQPERPVGRAGNPVSPAGSPVSPVSPAGSPVGLPELGMSRRNGDLAFDAPWQSRVFALAAAVVDTAFGGDREPFRQQLIAAIAADPGRPYWESWTAALEALVQTMPQRRNALTEPHQHRSR